MFFYTALDNRSFRWFFAIFLCWIWTIESLTVFKPSQQQQQQRACLYLSIKFHALQTLKRITSLYRDIFTKIEKNNNKKKVQQCIHEQYKHCFSVRICQCFSMVSVKNHSTVKYYVWLRHRSRVFLICNFERCGRLGVRNHQTSLAPVIEKGRRLTKLKTKQKCSQGPLFSSSRVRRKT